MTVQSELGVSTHRGLSEGNPASVRGPSVEAEGASDQAQPSAHPSQLSCLAPGHWRISSRLGWYGSPRDKEPWLLWDGKEAGVTLSVGSACP